METINHLLGERGTFTISESEYTFWTKGTGPLVLLLHGWPVSSYHWRYLVPFLVEKGYKTLSVDLKGLGYSQVIQKNSSFSKEDIALDICKLIQNVKKNDEKYSVLGHDWGGSIAIAMGCLDEKNINKIIIEEEVPPGIEVSIKSPAEEYPEIINTLVHNYLK